MRFMMLMIPEGYEKAQPDKMPDPEAVAAMMKYNEALREAGVLLSLDGLHPPSRWRSGFSFWRSPTARLKWRTGRFPGRGKLSAATG